MTCIVSCKAYTEIVQIATKDRPQAKIPFPSTLSIKGGLQGFKPNTIKITMIDAFGDVKLAYLERL